MLKISNSISTKMKSKAYFSLLKAKNRHANVIMMSSNKEQPLLKGLKLISACFILKRVKNSLSIGPTFKSKNRLNNKIIRRLNNLHSII